MPAPPSSRWRVPADLVASVCRRPASSTLSDRATATCLARTADRDPKLGDRARRSAALGARRAVSAAMVNNLDTREAAGYRALVDGRFEEAAAAFTAQLAALGEACRRALVVVVRPCGRLLLALVRAKKKKKRKRKERKRPIDSLVSDVHIPSHPPQFAPVFISSSGENVSRLCSNSPPLLRWWGCLRKMNSASSFFSVFLRGGETVGSWTILLPFSRALNLSLCPLPTPHRSSVLSVSGFLSPDLFCAVSRGGLLSSLVPVLARFRRSILLVSTLSARAHGESADSHRYDLIAIGPSARKSHWEGMRECLRFAQYRGGNRRGVVRHAAPVPSTAPPCSAGRCTAPVPLTAKHRNARRRLGLPFVRIAVEQRLGRRR